MKVRLTRPLGLIVELVLILGVLGRLVVGLVLWTVVVVKLMILHNFMIIG